MLIKCVHCGQDILVETDLQDGQHVLCPFCGKKSAYSRPKRIELPSGFSRPKASEGPVPQVAPQPPAPEPEKSVLKLDREAGRMARETKDPSAEKRIYMAEEHARFYEELKNLEARRKAVGKIAGIVSFVILLGGSYAAYVLWTDYRAKENAELIARRAESLRIEKARAAEEERHRKVQIELERTERERREKERADAKARKDAEEVRIKEEVRANKELFFDAARMFAESDLDFIAALPTNAVPGKAEGRFFYLVPSIDEELQKVVVCDSAATGVTNLFLLDSAGSKFCLQKPDEFFARIERSDYLLAQNDRIYFHSKRAKPHVGELKKDAPTDLTKEFFGQIEPKVRVFDCDFDNLAFEVVFIPANSRKVIVSEVVNFGQGYSMEKIREAVEEAFPYRARSHAAKKDKSRFRRTVVFWDGAHIKKGVDGVTYVPRVAPDYSLSGSAGPHVHTYGNFNVIRPFRDGCRRWRRAEHTREYWESLRREAERQDREEATFHQARQDEGVRAENLHQDKAMTAYREKIDGILERGKLYFRARLRQSDSPGTQE